MCTTTGRQLNAGCRRQQSGASAIEFALLLPLLIFIIYATIVYGYMFFLQQTINLLAQEGAKAAVAVATYDSSGNPVTPNYSAAVSSYFDAAKANGLLSALPAAQQADISVITTGPFSVSAGGGAANGFGVKVTVKFSNVNTVFPQIGLPGIGANLPPMPTDLQASAVARVS